MKKEREYLKKILFFSVWIIKEVKQLKKDVIIELIKNSC